MGISKWILLCFPFALCAQTNRYFVHFKDKANSSYSINRPLQFLSQKSVDRRAKENFTITQEDFPVNASYVSQVKATGASVHYTSRWFNGVLIQANASIIPTIQTLPFVSYVELVAPNVKLQSVSTASKNKFETSRIAAVQNLQQLQLIGLDKMQALGFRGEGIDVAVFDDGFIGVNTLAAFQNIYNDGRLKETFNFVKNTSDVYSDDDHGEKVLSVIAGNTGTYLGGAYQANFYLYETEDVTTEYRIEEYNWLFAAERADSIGIDVINSSLGYNTFDDPAMNYTQQDLNGKTAVVSRAAHAAALRGIVVVNAAGNVDGSVWTKILFPADAEGILSCAAVDINGLWSGTSLLGPSSDGRVKPDVAAVGRGTSVINSSGSIIGDDGTSFSAPLIASLAIGLRQAQPQASAAEIYSRVIASASLATHPTNQLGYGIPNFEKANALTSFANPLLIYPNPVTSSQVKVLFKNPSGQFSFSLFDTTGKLVFEITDFVSWQNNPYPIDMPFLPSGVYIARVVTVSFSNTMRLVKIN